MNRSSTLSSLLALSLLLFAVLACRTGGKEFSMPADKQDYVGDWQGKSGKVSMTLSIAPDGTVNYERKEGTTGSISISNSKTISGGKITKFDGNDFEVKAFVVSTTFKVEKPPYRDGNRWKMVVDGMEVSRKDKNSTEVSIDVAEMRKDDGNGKMSSEVSDTFTQSDKVIHCFINLDNPKTGTRIKFVTIAVDAGGAKDEPISEAKLTTENEFQNEAYLKLSKRLPKGDYKVDIYINDKLQRTVPFKVI